MTVVSSSFNVLKHKLSWTAPTAPPTSAWFYITKKTNLKSITVNWKISKGTWPNPNEQLDDARTDTGRTAPSLLLLFFFTLYKFCRQFNQFCRAVTAQAGSPRRRAPCRCCEQSCPSLQQLHGHRDHALPARCRLAQCTALGPWEVSVQPPVSCLQRAGKGLGKRLHAGTQRIGRICFQEPLAASSQASNAACTAHNHCKAVGIRHLPKRHSQWSNSFVEMMLLE